MTYLLLTWRPRTYYIMVNKTSGKKYVGQTTLNITEYLGSGPYWIKHCKKYGGYNKDNINVLFHKFFICEKSAQQWLDQFAMDNPNYDDKLNEEWANQCLETTFSSPWIGDGTYQRNVQLNRVANGTHPSQNLESIEKMRISALKNAANDDFFAYDENYQEECRQRQLKMVQDGTHNLLGKNNPVHKQIENGTFHLFGGEIQRNAALKAVEEGTHPFLKNKGCVPCYNKNGEYVRVPKDIYELDKQNNPNWNDREYASMLSFEGKKRAKEKLNSPL